MLCKFVSASIVSLSLSSTYFAYGQETLTLPSDTEGSSSLEMDTIHIDVRKLAGSVRSTIHPEEEYDSEDIQALGVTSIAELITELSPNTGGGRGRGGEGPVILLDGMRIPSPREIRAYPSEAVERVEVLPEEVALAYGYPANQKVINIILKSNFQAFTTEAEFNLPEAGSGETYEIEPAFLNLHDGDRTSLDLQYTLQNPISESDRENLPTDALLSPRYLQSDNETIVLKGAHNIALAEATRLGLSLAIDKGNTFDVLGTSEDGQSLVRELEAFSAELGANYSSMQKQWMISINGLLSQSQNESFSTNDTKTQTDTADIQALISGPVFELPAGKVNATFGTGYTNTSMNAQTYLDAVATQRNSSRAVTNISSNIDVPILDAMQDIPLLQRLNLNFNARVEDVSDFDTVSTLGGGFNWDVNPVLSFIVSYSHEEAAPSIDSLTAPLTITPERRVFDYQSGETVLVDRISGGNPDLAQDTRNVIKIGAQIEPFSEINLSFRADYIQSKIDDLSYSFSEPTAELEALFPERFVRDPDDNSLLSVDARPINAYKQEQTQITWGFDYSAEVFKDQKQAAGKIRPNNARPPTGGPPPDRAAAGSGPRPTAGGRGPGGRGGPPGARSNSGRFRFSIDHTWKLKDELTLTALSTPIDFLDGSSSGSKSGTSEHTVDARAFFFYKGKGVRLNYTWKSDASSVSSADTPLSNLYFDAYASTDLKFFYMLQPQSKLVQSFDWLNNVRLELELNNLFDEKPVVYNGFGDKVDGYFEDELDPIGRNITFEIRKQF